MGMLALVSLWGPLPVAESLPADIFGEQMPIFNAWDCHDPEQIQVLGIPEQCTDNNAENEMKNVQGKEEKVTIYQKSKNHFLAIRCLAYKSSMTIFCGMFSHEEIVRPMEIRRPMEISIEECEQMHSSGVWTSKNNRNHPIKVPGTTYLNFIEAGRMTYHHHQVSCEGTDVVIDGKIYEGIVSLVDVEIEVEEVAARKTEKGFEVREGALVISKSERDGKMTRSKGTFLWKRWWQRTQRCPLLKMTDMKVKLLTSKNNQTIIFNEKHKIYIILTNQALADKTCKEGAYFETNLDNILVKRKLGEETKETTEVEAASEVDVNIGNLVNEINDYAVGVLRAEIQASEERSGCKRLLQQVHNGNVEKLPNMNGELTMVRGELAIQVKCKAVEVVHHLSTANICYELLPVQLKNTPRKEAIFLEPISRVIKKSSAMLPCSAAIQGFKAANGRFYKASPQLTPIEKPDKSIFSSKIQDDSSSGKGLYSFQELQRLDEMLSWSNLKVEEQGSKRAYTLDQPIWKPNDGEEDEEAEGGTGGWSMNNLFSIVSKWRYGLAAVVVPTVLALGAWMSRVVGLTSGCVTDARMGGVGIADTLLSVFCHSYLQGKKQADQRRQAIPEVNVRMNFLQQVDRDVQEMRRSKNLEDVNTGEDHEGKLDNEDQEKKPKELF